MIISYRNQLFFNDWDLGGLCWEHWDCWCKGDFIIFTIQFFPHFYFFNSVSDGRGPQTSSSPYLTLNHCFGHDDHQNLPRWQNHGQLPMQACPTVARCRRTRRRGKAVAKQSSTMLTPLSHVEPPLRLSQHQELCEAFDQTRVLCQVALAGTASLGKVETTIEHDTKSAIITFKGEILSLASASASWHIAFAWQVRPTFGLESDSTQGQWLTSLMLSS